MKNPPVPGRQVLLGLAILTLFGAPGVVAKDLYMSLSGAGSRDGGKWENAFSYDSAATVLNSTMQPGDTLFLEGNDYGKNILTIDSSGAADARKSLVGVDRGVAGFPRPLFPGNSRSTNAGGNIMLKQGASYWTIKNLQSNHRGWGLKTEGGNRGLIVDGVYTYDSVNGLGFTDCDDLLVINCKAERYTRYGIHLIHSCDNAVIRNCYTDCSGTGDVPDLAWWGGCNPVGFYFHTDTAQTPPNTKVLVEDCVTRNNRQVTKKEKDFEQGDGFMAEFNNDGLTFRRCLSYDNQQGAYDLKGLNQVLEDCYAIRSGNGFKIWKNGTLTNCIATETKGNTVMLIGSKDDPSHILDAKFCTFNVGTAGGGAAVWIERGEKGTTQATLTSCLVTQAKARKEYKKEILHGGYSGAAGNVDLQPGTPEESFKYDEAAESTLEPHFTAPLEPWLPWLALETATAYDSTQYGLEKGYNSNRTKPSPLTTWAALIAKADAERIPVPQAAPAAGGSEEKMTKSGE